jgi:hypothetical protein
MSFTCPLCGRVSYHPDDEKYRYCGACHLFTDDFIPGARVGFTFSDVEILEAPKVPRLEGEIEDPEDKEKE